MILSARLRWGECVKNVSGYAVTGTILICWSAAASGTMIHAEDEHGPNSAPYHCVERWSWRSAFNADPGVVGTTVRLYNDPFTVIGVAAGAGSTARSDLIGPTITYRS